MTCAIVSGVTVFHYQLSLSGLVFENLFPKMIADWDGTFFVNKDEPLKFTDQENTAVAITSLVVIFSIIEVALAVCGAWSSDSPYQPPQGNQVSQVCEVISLCLINNKYRKIDSLRNYYKL